MEFTASMVAQLLKGSVEGDPETRLNTIAKIEEGHEGALSFLANPKYEPYIYTTLSSAVLVRNDFKPSKEIRTTLIRVADPYQALAQLLAIYEKSQNKPKKGIHPTAVIEQGAVIGNDVYIGAYAYVSDNALIGDGCSLYPHVYIGDSVRIGKNCTLHPGVKIYRHCLIGDDCILHAGVVIGADGFGFAPVADANYMKIPQVGNVILEDRVEIGANTCIDRATMGSTIIRQGVKLDNLLQVGHNVEIGENTVIAAQSGVAGSSKVGRNCMFGGQVGISGHITIADGTKIGAQSGIMGSVTEENTVLFGYPAFESKQYMRSLVYFKKLPELGRKVDEVGKLLESLKNK
ncbi:MAG: UDP-3-O-(3-hydroxymyristoyl)glucosamine N-acyltransferase [Bacteroidales bacterium]|jgi:UDP-3-O-[3-hydroxymyristoyl] glucosamine N-acyltransferase|nr:UDP-3-O-(3-hydroxymyristoyl)glucosamine N-acyltransferase [Bacteroidales bacterium]